MERETLTVEEVAKLLGVGRQTAYRMVRQGRLPVLRLGQRPVLKVPVKAFEAWMMTQAGVQAREVE